MEPAGAGRGSATRDRLLTAAVELLAERGYGDTSTEAVRKRAGVSRGSLLYQFPSRADLVVAAIGHIASLRVDRLHEAAQSMPAHGERIPAALTVLREANSGPLFLAGLELWMAARTDHELHRVLLEHERAFGRDLRQVIRKLFGPEAAASPSFDDACELALLAFRGQAITSVLRTDPDWGSALPPGLEAAMRSLLISQP